MKPIEVLFLFTQKEEEKGSLPQFSQSAINVLFDVET